MMGVITPHAYDIALLLSVAIVAATGGAWWSDNHWRRKYLSLRRRHGLTIGKPLDYYEKSVSPHHKAQNTRTSIDDRLRDELEHHGRLWFERQRKKERAI